MLKKSFLVLFSLLFFSATEITAQKLTLDLKNSPVDEVFSSIKKQTGYSVWYKTGTIDPGVRVNVSASNSSIEDVMSQILKDKSLTYTINGKQISITKKGDAASAPKSNKTKKITGTIADKSGEPIIGANVVVKGTTNGTITDFDGNYTLEVPEDATLLVSYIGYTDVAQSVAGKSALNIVMNEDTKNLDEIVVVGYTTQRKADLSGAVSSVKIDDVKNMMVTGINHAMQGKMSGVTVMQNGGAPGASASVRIRGLGTIGDNNPLYVIDGVPADNMNDINPADIERIDVLKDAASSAIYGSRAANGVVIIQTRKGKEGEKTNVSFSTSQGFQQRMKTLDVMDAQQRNLIHSEAYTNDGKKVPDYYGSPYAQTTRTNWQDEIFQNAYMANYDLGVSGGSKLAKYSIMLGHLNNDGIIKRSGYNRTTLRVNTDIKVSPTITIGENLMLTRSNQDKVDTRGASGALSTALQYQPDIPVYDENGNLSGSGALGADLQNPMGIINRSDRREKRDRVFGNLYAQWEIIKGLSLKTDFGYDYTNWYDKWFQEAVTESGRATDDNALEEYKKNSVRWLNTTTLKYDATFKTSKLMALIGTSYESFDIQKSKARGVDFLSQDPSQRYMSSAGRIQYLTGDRAEWALQSYFARIDYSLMDRYIFSANVRMDGSSKFAKNNRWGVFPSFSGAWRISEEKFFQPVLPYVENLKLRASWGQLGNQNIYDYYPTYSIYENTIESDGYDPVFGKDEAINPGRHEANIPNKDIKWESTTQTNIGIDVNFLKNFELVFDYFNKETSHVLVEVPVPSLAGVSQNPYANAARVRNRGWEMNLNYSNKAGDFTYTVYGNLSSIKNEVLSLGGGKSAIYHSSYRGDNITRTAEGMPMAHFYGYKTDGIFKTDEEAAAYVNQDGKPYQSKAKAGDLKFMDINGDGKIDGNDRTNIGDGFPDLTYGFGANLGYKGLDFSFMFQGVAGYDIYNALKWEGNFVKPEYNQFASIMDRFHPTNNPNGSVPRATIDDPNSNKRASDYYVEKGDYLRLKNITVGYTFKGDWMKKAKIQSLRVYGTAQNLFTITKYSGLDPELGETYADNVDAFGVSEIAVDRGQFPQARSFIFGVNVNF